MMKRIFLIASPLLFLLACAMPALLTERSENDYWGIACLLIGPLSFFYNLLYFIAWAANPFYFFALFLSVLNKAKFLVLIFSGIAFLFSLFAFNVESILLDEAGNQAAAWLGAGAYVWMGSFICLFIYGLLPAKQAPKEQP